jgi:hypothetical protein
MVSCLRGSVKKQGFLWFAIHKSKPLPSPQLARLRVSALPTGRETIGRPRPLMNLYFSCSLTGGRKDEAVYAAIVDHLLAQGHEVPTSHLAHPDVMELEKVVDAREVYLRDVAWIQACDGMIAEVSTPSHGVGYEIAYALSLGKPVLCCHRRGAPVSKMIIGNDHHDLTVVDYSDGEEVLVLLDSFLERLMRGKGVQI